MTDPTQETQEQPAPVTGVPEIDRALAGLDLTGPVGEHHQQLSAAVEELQRALRTPQQ